MWACTWSPTYIALRIFFLKHYTYSSVGFVTCKIILYFLFVVCSLLQVRWTHPLSISFCPLLNRHKLIVFGCCSCFKYLHFIHCCSGYSVTFYRLLVDNIQYGCSTIPPLRGEIPLYKRLYSAFALVIDIRDSVVLNERSFC